MCGGTEKVNAVNYLDKLPPATDNYYYEEDSMLLMIRRGVSDQNAKGLNQENWRQDQGNQGQSYGNYDFEGQYVQDGN